MTLSLFILAVAPALAICGYIIHKDRFDKEPPTMILLAFCSGLFSVFPAAIGNYTGEQLLGEHASFINTALFAFLVVGVSEEYAKFFFLRYILYNRKSFNEPLDGIVYAVMIAMGFATFENILYVSEGGVTSAMIRMITAVPAHAIFAVVMGYYVGLSKFDLTHKPELLRKGLIYPILLHGAYDFFLMQKSIPMLSLLSIIGIVFALKKIPYIIRQSESHSPFNNENEQ